VEYQLDAHEPPPHLEIFDVLGRTDRWIRCQRPFPAAFGHRVSLGGSVDAMKTSILSFAVLPFFLGACTSTSRLERSTDLGFGFRRAVVAEPSSSSFESIGHFECLYYRDRRLCQLGDCSVSPSGSYAVYQDGPSGNLFLFRRADGQLTQLTSQFVALVGTFEWHEDMNTVDAHFTDGHGVRRFALR
jgi:hypothetical protein